MWDHTEEVNEQVLRPQSVRTESVCVCVSACLWWGNVRKSLAAGYEEDWFLQAVNPKPHMLKVNSRIVVQDDGNGTFRQVNVAPVHHTVGGVFDVAPGEINYKGTASEP